MSCKGVLKYLQFIKCYVKFHGRHMHILSSPRYQFRGLSELYHMTEYINCQYGHIRDTLQVGARAKTMRTKFCYANLNWSILGQLYEVLIVSDVVTISNGHHSTSHMPIQGASASSYAAQRNTNARYHTLCPSYEAMTTLLQAL